MSVGPLCNAFFFPQPPHWARLTQAWPWARGYAHQSGRLYLFDLCDAEFQEPFPRGRCPAPPGLSHLELEQPILQELFEWLELSRRIRTLAEIPTQFFICHPELDMACRYETQDLSQFYLASGELEVRFENGRSSVRRKSRLPRGWASSARKLWPRDLSRLLEPGTIRLDQFNPVTLPLDGLPLNDWVERQDWPRLVEVAQKLDAAQGLKQRQRPLATAVEQRLASQSQDLRSRSCEALSEATGLLTALSHLPLQRDPVRFAELLPVRERALLTQARLLQESSQPLQALACLHLAEGIWDGFLSHEGRDQANEQKAVLLAALTSEWSEQPTRWEPIWYGKESFRYRFFIPQETTVRYSMTLLDSQYPSIEASATVPRQAGQMIERALLLWAWPEEASRKLAQAAFHCFPDQPEEALHLVKRALELDPNNETAQASLQALNGHKVVEKATSRLCLDLLMPKLCGRPIGNARWS